MKTLTIFSTTTRWAVAVLLFYYSSKIDEPLMFKFGTISLFIIPLLIILNLIRSYQSLKSNRSCLALTFEKALFFLVLLSALIVFSYDTIVFQYKQRVVLTAPEDLLTRLGSHFIVGYQRPEELQDLLKKRAVGGVYVTSRNIRGKTLEEVRQELRSFQTIAADRGGPPLFVAADQEGGQVSRLTPLVKPLPPLSSIIVPKASRQRIIEDVKTYAAIQAEQLYDLGINLNLSPVVDLKTNHFNHKLNFRSRIDKRAISSNADIVAEVAAIYCAALLDHGVRPTLKHFPGLGSVMEDTHVSPGILNSSKAYLEQNDWLPFRKIITQTTPFIMLGHVRVACIDPALPASLSPAVLTGMIRDEWKFDGVLITDDLNMGAIAQRKEGIGRSAVRALNAGADLILLSYDGRQYYKAMYEMIKAYQSGTLNWAALKKSHQRLKAFSPPSLKKAD